ncbi:MAG: hypothetical protein ACRD8U_15190 [Pyrinomonadaceae bacterium]
MKMIILCTALLLPTLPAKSFIDPPLEGCPDPNAVEALLTRIRDSNWQHMPLERLRSVWPTELTDIECDSKVSRSLISHNRVINGHCQCCATFSFKIPQNQGAARIEQLDSVIFNYSARHRDELVGIAKKFARAAGLRQGELKIVGRDSEQSFQWEATKGGKRNLYTLELHFSRQGRLWELYFNSGWNIIEPASSDPKTPDSKKRFPLND